MDKYLNKPVGKSRDIIVKEAFKLFLQKNVEKVTVPELEQATKLCRGAIFYHFKDKEAIFTEVIETYFFSPLNIFYPLCPEQADSLEMYWKKRRNHMEHILIWFKEERISFNPYSAFFHLAEQADLYIPSFKERMRELLATDRLYWKQAVQSDALIRKKMINSDEIGAVYRATYIGQCYVACYNGGEFPSCCPGSFEESDKLFGKNVK